MLRNHLVILKSSGAPISMPVRFRTKSRISLTHIVHGKLEVTLRTMINTSNNLTTYKNSKSAKILRGTFLILIVSTLTILIKVSTDKLLTTQQISSLSLTLLFLKSTRSFACTILELIKICKSVKIKPTWTKMTREASFRSAHLT